MSHKSTLDENNECLLASNTLRFGGPEQVKAGRELWISPGFSCRGGISVGQFVHHLWDAGSHFDPSICLALSEPTDSGRSRNSLTVRLHERPPSSDDGLFAFYRQFWQPLQVPLIFSKSPARFRTRLSFATPASAFRADLAQNSRLSLRLAASGLTTVASARPVGIDKVASGKRSELSAIRVGLLMYRLTHRMAS